MGEARGVRHCQHLLRLSPDHTRGTDRLRPPAEMLAGVLPLLPLAGVTRLANITGLDRIGIPVVVAVRPNGRTLSQAAGRGVTLELAMLSAAMESIEIFHAEVAQLPALHAPYAELARHHAVIPLEQLPLTRHSLFSPSLAERWTFGRNLIAEGSQEEIPSVAVPLDLVLLPRRTERVRDASLFSFQTTSNGLASGSAFVEAVFFGLLEVIERDAVACWRWLAAPRVRLESARNFPAAREVLQCFERAGVRVLVYDCTLDTDVPVYRAVLYEAAERRVGLAEGWGAHLDPELALVRALTEAAQSRAVSIAGARDDRFGRDIARVRLTDSQKRIAELEAQPETIDLRERQKHATPTLTEDVDRLLQRLHSLGLNQAIAVDLTLPEFRDVLSVVRVIVPGLDGPGFEQGRRATAFASRNGVGR